MNNLAAMLYVEITIMCFLIMGIIVCRLFKSLDRRWEHQVLIMTLSLFQLAILCDGAWTALTASAVSLPRWLLWAVNHGYFIAISLGCLGWFLYAEKQQNASVNRKPWRIALVAIPMLAMVAMILLSPFTHWIFFIDEQNVYHRGPLHGLHIFVSYGYMLFASIRAMILALQ